MTTLLLAFLLSNMQASTNYYMLAVALVWLAIAAYGEVPLPSVALPRALVRPPRRSVVDAANNERGRREV